jgi:hypothetical protein
MSRSTYSQRINSARRQITNSSNAVCASKKLINKGESLINNSKISITNSKYRFVLSVSSLTNCFLIATSQKFASFLDLPPTQNRRKSTNDCFCLTPQENLQQIMTHPFKTGLCPYCGYAFPKVKKRVLSWNCLFCGWADNLFDCIDGEN